MLVADDAGGARVCPAMLGQPRTLELGVDVGATGLDKYGVSGPRLGLLGGRRDLVDAIRARAIELGLEARPLLIPAVVRSLERYRPERVRELVAATDELGDALERRLGTLVTRTPFALKLRGEDLLRAADGEGAVPVEATAAVAMQLLRDHGLLTVHFAAVPPGTPDLLLKFVPPETLASLGGAEALADAIEGSVERALTAVSDLDELRALLFGRRSRAGRRLARVDVLGLTSLLAELPTERTRLLDNLGRIRRAAGPITPDLADALADHMNLRRGDVHEVASFYSFLQVPVDAVRVCTGPVCDCLGARELLAREPGAVEVPCLGHCDLAPVLLRGDAVEPARHAHDERWAVARARGRRRASSRSSPSLPSGSWRSCTHPASPATAAPASRPRSSGRRCSREPGPRVLAVNADEGEPGTIKDRYVLELRPRLLVAGDRCSPRTRSTRPRSTSTSARSTASRAPRLEAAIAESGLDRRGCRRRGRVHRRRGDGDARVDGGPPRDAAPAATVSRAARAPGAADADPQRRDAGAPARDPPARRRERGRRSAAAARSGVRLWSVSGAVRNARLLRGAERDHAARARRRARRRLRRRARRDRPGRRGERDPPARCARRAADARRPRTEYGAGVGSAGVQVFPADYPPLRLLERTYAFFAEESCGKCTPCRIGNRALHHARRAARARRGAAATRERLEEWLEAMERTSICGLGQAAPIPIRNATHIWPSCSPAGGAVG